MKVVIVPGSCSTKTNWLDQELYFSSLGYEYCFCELEAYRFTSFSECANNIFRQLQLECEKQSKPNNSIVTHSMGGMLILYILANEKIYKKIDPETFDFIINSNLFFVQVPVKASQRVKITFDIIKWLFLPIMFVHSGLFFRVIDDVLAKTKRLFAKPHTILNLLSITNSVFGTSPKGFWNLIEYYKNLDFTIFNNVKPITTTPYQNSHQNKSNIFFSTGFPDYFCDGSDTQNFAKLLNAEVKDFPWSFHNPMYFTWSQRKLHDWIIRQIIE